MSEATTSLFPHLCCRDALSAIEFYKKAFGAELVTLLTHNGGLMHGAISIGGAQVLLMEECVDFGAVSPLTLGNTAVAIHLEVPNCDEFHQRAVDAGCESRLDPGDMFWGARYGVVSDPYGHKWSISTTTKQLTQAEIEAAAAAAFATPCQ